MTEDDVALAALVDDAEVMALHVQSGHRGGPVKYPFQDDGGESNSTEKNGVFKEWKIMF